MALLFYLILKRFDINKLFLIVIYSDIITFSTFFLNIETEDYIFSRYKMQLPKLYFCIIFYNNKILKLYP